MPVDVPLRGPLDRRLLGAVLNVLLPDAKLKAGVLNVSAAANAAKGKPLRTLFALAEAKVRSPESFFSSPSLRLRSFGLIR